MDGEGSDAHPAAERRGELRVDAGVRAARRAAPAQRRSAAVVRGGRDGRARRRQSREGLRLVLLRRHLARHQQRAHRHRQRARQAASRRGSPHRLQARVHRIEGRTSAELLGVEAAATTRFVAGAKVQLHSTLSVFGEYARYVWGPTATSAELLGVDPEPIVKPGYYVGGTFEVPVTSRARAGVTVTREEISRDDSLVKYLAANGLYGVALGKKDRGTIARVYVERRAPRDLRPVLGRHLEPVSVDQRQLAGGRRPRVHRPRAGSVWDHGDGADALTTSVPSCQVPSSKQFCEFAVRL